MVDCLDKGTTSAGLLLLALVLVLHSLSLSVGDPPFVVREEKGRLSLSL